MNYQFAQPRNQQMHVDLMRLLEAVMHLDQSACVVLRAEPSTDSRRPLITIEEPPQSEFWLTAQDCNRSTINETSYVTRRATLAEIGVDVQYHTTQRVPQ